jgi:23S rRNA pseudouridine1911/1915/1917 synthase
MTPLTAPVRHQDQSIIIVDKPHGLATAATTDPKQPHLYGQLCARFPYVGLHHRLDTPASGLVLFTIDRAANKSISHGFKHHRIARRYLAVVAGDPGSSGIWHADIGQKSAVTHFERLSTADGMSLIEARLETGRTHQIRIHAAGAGHPVIGDRRHGGRAGRLWPRLALHAVFLGFSHPRDRSPLRVWAPPPSDLTLLLAPLLTDQSLDLARRYSPETEAG